MSKYTNEIEQILSTQPEIKIYYFSINNDTISATIELKSEDIRKKQNLKTTLEFEKSIESKLKYLSSK
jgi:hypothetical protein